MSAAVVGEKQFELIFDCDKLKVACVLLQAAHGCDSSLVHHFGFDTRAWEVYPTDGMRRIRGTEAEWRKAAEMANKKHKQV